MVGLILLIVFTAIGWMVAIVFAIGYAYSHQPKEELEGSQDEYLCNKSDCRFKR